MGASHMYNNIGYLALLMAAVMQTSIKWRRYLKQRKHEKAAFTTEQRWWVAVKRRHAAISLLCDHAYVCAALIRRQGRAGLVFGWCERHGMITR